MKTRMKSWEGMTLVRSSLHIGNFAKYHPTKSDDAVAATARFKEVSEAYETLTKESDPEDMFRGMSFDPSMFAQMFRTRVHVVTVQLDLKEMEGANVEACMQTTEV
jgi:hypothetical protein